MSKALHQSAISHAGHLSLSFAHYLHTLSTHPHLHASLRPHSLPCCSSPPSAPWYSSPPSSAPLLIAPPHCPSSLPLLSAPPQRPSCLSVEVVIAPPATLLPKHSPYCPSSLPLLLPSCPSVVLIAPPHCPSCSPPAPAQSQPCALFTRRSLASHAALFHTTLSSTRHALTTQRSLHN